VRILHVLDHSLPLHSGYAFRTVSILREQRIRGWETVQLTTPRHGTVDCDIEEVEGWRFHRTRCENGAGTSSGGFGYFHEMAATARRMSELVRDFRPDVIHAHSPVLNVLPALWIGRRYRIPVVYEVRALWEDAAVDHGVTKQGSLRYRASRALETFALRRADSITTICEGLRSEIAARGIAPSRIVTIPNAVDAAAFHLGSTANPELAAKLGLTGKTVIGFVGSFYGYEGLDLLIDAVALLAPSNSDLRALLVGGGMQEAALRAQAVERGVADRVVFSGRVPHDEVHRYYDLIDVLAYPRHRMRLTELVTPLKPLEGMAQGRMIVASDVGGHRELIRDGETGALFPAGDASALARTLQRMLDSRSEWPRYRERARRFVERERTWARSVANYVDVYEPLLPGKVITTPEAGLDRR
jgi:PEP-CTERM/exosortase A-associated glycosyltransferase